MDHLSKSPSESLNSAPSLPFAHPSEAEFAKILDFYGIRWLYEPTSFPIKWDEAGRALEAFTPDFYFPDHDLYVELTTLRQKLTSRKRQKIRRFLELYPDVKLLTLYSSDFDRLLLKYTARGESNAVAKAAAIDEMENAGHR